MSAARIALDVMGGDHAPEVVLRGALQACTGDDALPRERVLLVGDESVIRSWLAQHDREDGFSVLASQGAIGMDEKPAQALRQKPKASIPMGVGAVREGAAGAFVSMGNTGAVVGAATIGLGTLKGVRRPGIAVTTAVRGTPVTSLDMGANIVPRASDLVEYAVMGTILQRDLMEVANPRVGLLNIGEESSKGNDLVQEAHGLLAASGLNFVGNVEGGDLFQDRADVVVTDGFTGNVVLKTMEGCAARILELTVGALAKLSVAVPREVLEFVHQRIDYSAYGGALLVGVRGVVVIGHGRSDAGAVANALRVAARALDAEVNRKIEDGLARAAQASSEA